MKSLELLVYISKIKDFIIHFLRNCGGTYPSDEVPLPKCVDFALSISISSKFVGTKLSSSNSISRKYLKPS